MILSEDLWDHEYVERYTTGFEAYREYVKTFPPERAEQITGVPAADIIAAESGATVWTLDPAVTGPDDKDAYLDAMERNMETLVQALS